MTIVRSFLFALTLLWVPIQVMAHGADQHVMGTVTAIDANHIEVKTTKGASVTVKVTDQTQFISKAAKRPSEPPQVGDRVVIDVTRDGTVMTATEVQYSNAKPKAAPKTPKAP